MRRMAVLALLVTAGCGDRQPTPTVPTPDPVPVVVAPAAAVPDPAPPALRIGTDVVPTRVALDLTIVPDQTTFKGRVAIDARVAAPTRVVWLNATELVIEAATLNAQPARVIPGGDDFIGLTTDAELAPGPLVIEVAYGGTIGRTKSQGIYAEQEAGEWYAYTFFESIDARRAFPSFDQPDAKVPWQLTFHVKREHVALANAAVVREVDEPDGMKAVTLAESLPMPSYLVAFVVGPFEVVDGGTGGRIKTPIRFVVPKGRRDELGYALTVTPRVVAALENYFDMDYPYGKLDVAVVPRYWGTMEHPGIVAMGQPLTLIKPAEITRERRMAYTNILAHELAHYWFGDLVTLAWWDDAWLNESLGTWMDAIITDAAEPDWKFLDQRHTRAYEAMNADEKPSTRSIRQPVDSKEGIQSAFDGAITYYKGQTILHMFESWVGTEVWRDYIRTYITKYAWKNATADDFLAVMTDKLGAPVSTAFRTFLDQPGVPLIEHTLVCDGPPRLELHQRRAFPAGTTEDTPRTWHVPVCVRYGKGKASHRTCLMLTAADGTLPLEGACPTWLVTNADAVGYYRSRYTPGELAAVLGPKSPISMPERSMVLADIGAEVARDELDVGDAMAMAPLVIADRDERLRARAWGLTGPLRPTIFDETLYQSYRRWVLKAFGPTARKLGWRRKKGDSDDRQELRLNAVTAAAWAGDKALTAEAKKLARAWLADRAKVEPDIVTSVLSVAARHGDAALFDTILAAAKATKDRMEQMRLLGALGGFTDPALVARALELVRGTEFDLRESRAILFGVMTERESRELGWTFVRDHVDELLARLRSDEASWFVGGIGGMFCDAEHRDQVKALFAERATKIEGAQYTLQQALDNTDQCITAQARLVPSAAKFLAKY
jgi:alanyl aminopeptidase